MENHSHISVRTLQASKSGDKERASKIPVGTAICSNSSNIEITLSTSVQHNVYVYNQKKHLESPNLRQGSWFCKILTIASIAHCKIPIKTSMGLDHDHDISTKIVVSETSHLSKMYKN